VSNSPDESKVAAPQIADSNNTYSKSSPSRADGGSRIQRDSAINKNPSGTVNVEDASSEGPTEQNLSNRSKIARRKFIERPQSTTNSTDGSSTTLKSIPRANAEKSTTTDLPIDNPPPVSELPPELTEQAVSESPDSISSFDCSGLKTLQGWTSYAEKSGIDGIARELAMNMVPREEVNGVLTLVLDERSQHLFNDARLEKINQHLSSISGGTAPVISVSIEAITGAEMETPSLQKQRIVTETQQAAEQTFREDPNVQELVNLFDAEIIEGSVRPAID